MPQFRKKPVIVTAEQFLVDNPWPNGVQYEPLNNKCFVETIHNQRVYLEHLDWVLPEPDGIHYYPVKPDIFEATYEVVDP